MKSPVRQFLQQSWLVLLLAAALSAALAGVDAAFRERIAENARSRLEREVLQLVPDGARSSQVTLSGHEVFRVTTRAGDVCGWAAVANGRGFQDRIRILLALSADGSTLTGLAVLQNSETPGLGDRIREERFCSQFADKSTGQPLVRNRSGQTSDNGVDAITGATISSTAVITAVNEEVEVLKRELASEFAAGQEPDHGQ